jgi:glucosamine--fructose-6-phosphate aminotransferase (isomerizing)
MSLRSEINEIPQRARDVQRATSKLMLPMDAPYLGMGSSYFAALTAKYAGLPVQPELASEYDMYLHESGDGFEACLISQSGESTETAWCLEHFDEVTVLVNDANSTLARSDKATSVVDLLAGPEEFSSTKSYINTLIAIYQGNGLDCAQAVDRLTESFDKDAESAAALAQILAMSIEGRLSVPEPAGLYVLGSGPNLATAMQCALVLTETTKLPWQAMSVASFDHGPKEAADGANIIILDGKGRDTARIHGLLNTLRSVSCFAVTMESTGGQPLRSPIGLFVKVALLMDELATILNVGDPFVVGGKVTTVDNSLR